jgi:GT2 family glycosyltransferase
MRQDTRCDIIIPVWNKAAFTRDCVDSVSRNTDAGYRIIIVDNGSDAETRRYLEGLGRDNAAFITVARNEKNIGFVKAANQGLRLSDAPYTCLLNNDTIVAKGWLAEMLKVADSAGDIGIVNPSSNNLGQRPARGESVDDYAARLLKEETGAYVELGSAVGFCMLIKRGVIDKIGLFDEIYGMGNFEDTDFSRRAIRAGFRCVRACGAYVYHKEGTSFVRSKRFDEEFAANRAIYESRWGAQRRILYIVSDRGVPLSETDTKEMLSAARGGNWVYIYAKESSDTSRIPEHSNIVVKRFPDSFFRIRTALKILTKKKKFDQILDGSLSRNSFCSKKL